MSESCHCQSISPRDLKKVKGWLDTHAGRIPQIETKLDRLDRWGTIKVRAGIGRDDYRVSPGIYAIGTPDENSPVLVTANYKLSFDSVRQALGGRDVWLMALDTKGVNVWCAAGKGTFGTEEVIRRIGETKLPRLVKHRNLILPQLGAPGVAAHEVKKATGFEVTYGPVDIRDITAFLDAGCRATPEMRRVHFNTLDRLVLTPVELYVGWKYFLISLLLVFGLTGMRHGFTLSLWQQALPNLFALLGAMLMGAFFVPVLLPWIPGRAFAWKGWLLGLLVPLGLFSYGSLTGTPFSIKETIISLLLWPALSAFLAMNFTGASTFTSPSGVRKEMRYAVPLEIGSLVIGLALSLL
ncbi:MAG TPA: mercury methylation corrinoid protein HgcA [Chroococcales cyanobacterium]|jgi:hypothetical protein